MAIYFIIVISSLVLVSSGLNKNHYIQNPHEANLHSAPWIVSIQHGYNPTHICAGSIISFDWLVTAAHCLASRKGTFYAIAGRHHFEIENDESEQRRTINKIVIHDLYVNAISPYDIALGNVLPFKFNAIVRPIAVSLEICPSGRGKHYGWGSTTTDQFPITPTVLSVQLKSIIPAWKCLEILGDESGLQENNVCAQPLPGGVSACTGDSGGPLVQNSRLIGIVSWGRLPCGSVTNPTVYVNVATMRSWIENVMKGVSYFK